MGSEVTNHLLLVVPSSLYLLHTHTKIRTRLISDLLYLSSFLFGISKGLSESKVGLCDESVLQVQSLQQSRVSVLFLSLQQTVPLSHQSLCFLQQNTQFLVS